MDQVLAFAQEKVAQYANHADLHSQATQTNILQLLLAPVKSYFSIFTALSLPNFIPLLHSQPYPTRRAVAGEIAKTLLQNQISVDSEESLKSVLEILKVIIKEGTQQTPGYSGGPLQRKGAETDETIEEQGWLARIVHLLHGSTNDAQFNVSLMIGLSASSLLTTYSYYGRHRRYSAKVASASNIHSHPLSQLPSGLHEHTSNGNISKTTGHRNHRLCTNSCIPCYHHSIHE